MSLPDTVRLKESITFEADHDDVSIEYLVTETRRRRAELERLGMAPKPPAAPPRSALPPVSRRGFLRGLARGIGVTLALPYMDSLAWAAGLDAPAGPPKRWAALIFANGVNQKHWWARQEGGELRLSSSLESLAPFRNKLLFLENLHLFDNTIGVHTPYFTNFLAGEVIGNGTIPLLAESCDQYLARTVGRATPVPGLVLGIEPPSVGLAGGKPSIYNSTVSWSARTNPVPPEIFPRQTFDRLFDVKGLIRERSVLDFVYKQANGLRRDLSLRDRDKLDQYLTSVREIEQRIQRATAQNRFEGWAPTLREPNMERPGQARPQNVEEHMRLMLDLIVLAFQMDKTRVATFIFERDITGLTFEFLEGVRKTGMHTMSHHRNVPSTLDQYQKVNAFHARMFAYMLGKMEAIDEGNGTLLDNSMLLFGSTMMDGDIHDANQLPLILAGGKNCGIQGGRVRRYEKLADRRLCNLHLDLLNRMGLTDTQFGNSHYRLPGVGA
jgi:hypothetical protein